MMVVIKDAKFVKGIKGTDKIINDNIKHIAFFGRSNVGKSSMINTILDRKKLVKSSSKPGKTREINFFKTEIYKKKNGDENEKDIKNTENFYFVDLPGYGYARLSPKQREAIRKMIIWYLIELPEVSRINIVVLDAKVGLTDFDKELLTIIKETKQKALIILNKTDKLNQKEKNNIFKKISEEVNFPVILFSALKKKGVKDFFDYILNNR